MDRTEQFLAMPKTSMFSCQCEHSKDGVDQPWIWTTENKPRGYELYEMLGRPVKVVAPMVDASELSFRLLCKRYGADLCYSPMINSAMFIKEKQDSYRLREFSTCPADTNMFVQFCGHDPEILVEAGRMVERTGAKAIDLNLGCPQGIAKKGFYGAFLMDDIPLIRNLISAMDTNLSLPVTAKIRIFPDPLHTIAYAKTLVDAGATMLGVHGRLREAKGVAPGPADWNQIKMVREALPDVPMFANGNIWSYSDMASCLEATTCDGVMSADTLLWEPRLFSNPDRFLVSGRHFAVKNVEARLQAIATAEEYLDICETHRTQVCQIKNHVYKITHQSLQLHPDIRAKISEQTPESPLQQMSTGPESMLSKFRSILKELREAEMASPQPDDVLNPVPYASSIHQLGNVSIPDYIHLSSITTPVDENSEYRKAKDAKVKAMLEEEEPAYDLFG
eukprot:TRINITY_DN13814_c0_g1_i1.p1 TRINITY_DN13814_c0_g1~~TRINITY_DN13814_c0_g1_i1.p1  ORF type:complete len:449 (+),score=59.60 TRINITY_DN13814_c0_g1_i1:65-1411(+)